MRAALASIFALALVAMLCPVNASADGGEVGVMNVPPTIGQLYVGDGQGTNRIIVSVSDTNGRNDIQKVSVEFLDAAGTRTAAFVYTQWNDNRTEKVDDFKDLSGGWLIKSSSNAYRYQNGNFYMSCCLLNLTFMFNPGQAAKVKMNVTDMRNDSAQVELPFVAESITIPVPLRNPVATLSISLIAATAVTAIVVRGRYASDRLAMSVEKNISKKKRKKSIEELIER